jgi:hypothetical protein
MIVTLIRFEMVASIAVPADKVKTGKSGGLNPEQTRRIEAAVWRTPPRRSSAEYFRQILFRRTDGLQTILFHQKIQDAGRNKGR